jgi:uncharacterized SAM-binding protein YcdF (DUF218 family)
MDSAAAGRDPDEKVERLDAIVVLGCSLKFPKVLHDRVSQACRLLFAGAAPVLVASGGPNNEEGRPEADAMRDIAFELGAPRESLVVESSSMDTIENARFTAPILRARGVASAYLVTSAYHSRRAGIIFRHIIPGVRFVLSPADDHFDETEARRRAESELRLLAELEVQGFPVTE